VEEVVLQLLGIHCNESHDFVFYFRSVFEKALFSDEKKYQM
jgi:hypothetical protein